LDDLGQGYGVYMVDESGQVEKLEYVLLTETESINGILGEFAAAIKEEREPEISGRDNLYTLAALFATSDSSKEGKWKSIKDYL
jgi:predicted dehydrogenase